MPNDVKAAVSALALIVAAVLSYWSWVADPARIFDVCHGDCGIHGCCYVDFPGGGSEEKRQELVASKRLGIGVIATTRRLSIRASDGFGTPEETEAAGWRRALR